MIEVSGITKIYDAQKALDSVSFKIHKGEIVGLLGPNGAGKSTLMKIITCFIPPSEGDVNVCGCNIFEDPIGVRKHIGYLPEHNPLYLDMYVREFLQFVAEIHKVPNAKKRVEQMIEETGLTPEANKKISMLSKGYRQRVGLAQALIHDPEVLILDEPTTGLDPNQLEEIRSLIRRVGKEKIVLLSTHIMQEVEAVCSRVIIINHGKIVADDSTDNIHYLQVSKNQFIVEFNHPIDTKSLRQVQGIEKVTARNGNIYQVEATKGSDIRESLFRWAVDNNHAVLTIRREEESLEQIFQELTVK